MIEIIIRTDKTNPLAYMIMSRIKEFLLKSRIDAKVSVEKVENIKSVSD
jgi:hypothetical protein